MKRTSGCIILCLKAKHVLLYKAWHVSWEFSKTNHADMCTFWSLQVQGRCVCIRCAKASCLCSHINCHDSAVSKKTFVEYDE